MSWELLPALMREPAFESLNDQGHGAQRSVGPGGGLEVMGGGGLWRDHGLETLGSRPPTKTGGAGGQTASRPWAGTAQGSERGTYGRAGYQGEREQALTVEQEYTATSLMRGYRRSLWRAGTGLRQALLKEEVEISGKVTEAGTDCKHGTD